MFQEKCKGLVCRLKRIQEEEGFISEDNFKKISEEFGISIGEVFSTATFYSFLSTRQVGKNIIRVCKSLPCRLKDSESILDVVKKKLGIDIGETTKDKRFSLVLTNCIGACKDAPAIMINEKIYGRLTPARVGEILDSFK